MTLDEAIKHAEEVADVCEFEASKYDMTDVYEKHVACKEGECGKEHRQLAEWLKDYKRLLEQESVLDKIRAEIIDTGAYEQEVNGKTEFLKGIDYCLGVIDKYKAESEE